MSSSDESAQYSSPNAKDLPPSRAKVEVSQYQYNSDSSGSEFDAGHLYPKKSEDKTAPTPRKGRDKYPLPSNAPPSHTRQQQNAPATSPLTEPDINTSHYDDSGSDESDESDDDDIDFSPEKSSVPKKEPFYTPKQQGGGKDKDNSLPVSDSEKLAVASQLGGSSRLSPNSQSIPSAMEEESSGGANTQSTLVGNKRDRFASSASKGTSERTIDVFLDELQPSGASDSDPTRAKQQFSREASLKSLDTRSTVSSKGKSYRTPHFGDRHQTPNSQKSLEMQTMRSNNTPMTEISLGDTPSAKSKMAQSTGGASRTSFRELKKTFRRPYAKVNELGWRQSHWLRKWCIICSDSLAWEIGVLLLIVGNCITLAMASPLDDPESTKSKILTGIEWFFSVAFTIELITKIVAMGYFTDENAYMRDNWNILDFIIVTFGWVSEISGGGGGLTAMRAMRVLRPLRTIKGIPELKRIIEGMISSLPQLSTVFGLCAGVYILFGILGMQLFSGKMSQRCQDTSTLEWDFDSGRFCSMDTGYGRQCPEGSVCGDSGTSLNDNITSFDDIFKAFLTVFQSCTLEGWVDAMYCLMDTMHSVIPALFFVLLIWVGSLFLLNLVTVVVYISYSESADAIAELSDGPGESDDLAKDLETVTTENLLNIQENAKVLALQAVDDLNVTLLDTGVRPEGLRKRNVDIDEDGADDDEEEASESRPALAAQKSLRLQAVQLSEIASLLNAAVNQLVAIPNVMVHTHNHANDAKDEIPDYNKSPGKYICYMLVQSRYFQILMNLLIIFNTCCLASEHYDQSQAWTDFLTTANVWFTLIFTFEIYAKLKGLGLEKFQEDSFNTFDSAIVFISLIELMIGGEGGGGISALRSFRIMRLFKLLRSWTTLRRILKNMAKTMNSSSAFIGLLCLMIFVFSLVGMTMFGDTFDKECEEDSSGEEVCYAPRANYDSMFTAAVVSFQIMTMENWNEVLYIGILSNGIVAAIFIILNLLIGGFLMMNIFLAILIDNYSEAVHEEILKAKERERRHKEKERIRGILEKGGSSQYGVGGEAELDQLLYASSEESDADNDDSSDEEEDEKVILDEDAGAAELFKDPTLHPSYKYNSLCIFRSGGKIRHATYKLVLWPWFDRFILSLIIMNCVTLAVNQPGADGLGPQGTLGNVLTNMDMFFTIAFICEFSFKLIAFGLILHPGSYSRNSWNLLDGFIVVTSFIELGSSGDDSNMGSLRALRALRALRPLRLISRLEGLQIVINTMLRAFKPCASVASVALVFYTVFSIVGVNLFGGRFYSCNDPSRTCYPSAPGMNSALCPEVDACTGNWTNPSTGLVEDRAWQNPTYEETGTSYSFDNFFVGMLTLFEVASLEMWPSVMYSANDITSVGRAPSRNNSEGNSLFFVLFISVMTFFVMELFVTVIIDNFNEIKAERDGSAYMTEKQIEWVRTQKQLATRKPKEFIAPPPAEEKRRLELFNIVMGERFELVIMGFIILNTLFMMMEFKGQGDGWTLFLDVMNYIFAFIFTVEMFLKWFAMGTSAYFSNGWNRFDATIVTMTLISLVLDWCSVELPFDPTLLRVGRIARVFRIVKSSQSLKAITQTIFLSLPSMANVGMVLTLIFFIFAIAGMGIFGGMEKGDFINTWCNFDTFFMSLVTLFRCATGESWNGLMHDAMKHSSLAVFYFAVFQLVASYVLLNLFVAIILDQMSDQMEAVKEQASQLRQFSDAWKQAKLQSVGGDVMQLAINSSALTGEGAGQPGAAAVDGTNIQVQPQSRRRSMTDRFNEMVASRERSKKERWAKKEKNVHFLPAYYLLKLARILPSPLGLASAEDVQKELVSSATGRKEVITTEEVVEATNPNYEVLQFIRECDIPIVDGAWVEYKEVLHAVFFRATRLANEGNEDEDEDELEGRETQWFHLQQFQRNMPLEHDGKRYESDIPVDGEAAVDEGKEEGKSRVTVAAVDHKHTERFTADEWFACVAMQAWFRGSRGRKRVESIKEKRRSLKEMAQERWGDVGTLVHGAKKKKKKKKNREERKHKREGGMGRKYNLRDPGAL